MIGSTVLEMVNNGYTREMALNVIATGAADLVAFGRPFIANPGPGPPPEGRPAAGRA